MRKDKYIFVGFLAIPVLFFFILSLQYPAFPGIYMDAVNPDYLSAWYLKGNKMLPSWIYPDNYLAGMYHVPLLNSLYGGNPTAYCATLFFTVTGFGLEQLRIFHAMLGTLLLLSWVWCLRKWQCPTWIIALCGIALAVEPNFLYAWRTQYFLQLSPAICLFAALGLLGRHIHKQNNRSCSDISLAGLLLGFAAYSYFIYAFYAIAVVVIYTLINPDSTQPKLRIFWRLALFALLGWSPYLYAHLSIILNIGLDGYIGMLKGLQATYHIGHVNSQYEMSRIEILHIKLSALSGATGLENTIFAQSAVNKSLRLVHGILLVLPVIFSLTILAIGKNDHLGDVNRRSGRSYLQFSALIVGLMVAHLTLGIAAGSALNLQHFVSLLPIIFASLAVTLAFIVERCAGAIRCRCKVKAVTVTILICYVLVGISVSWGVLKRLKTESTSPIYSNAINTLAETLKATPDDSVLLFPQWGYWMGVLILSGPTHNVIEMPNLTAMTQRLIADPGLKNKQKFILTLGDELNKQDNATLAEQAELFASLAGLRIMSTREIRDVAGKKQMLVVDLQRK